ncbi:MAG: hypothetical protein ACI92G_002699 [Candidatus Pelagisphaera sp.]|jgi:hypothetical protein
MNPPRQQTLHHSINLSLFLSITLSLLLSIPPLTAAPLTPKTIQTGDFKITVSRIPENPIITYESSDTLGTKINGPSVIRVPDWIENPLGKYYLYFAHHDGTFIRLAYADAVTGPWTVHEPGTLKLEESPAFIGHIASPDVHIDHALKKVRMYYHGSREGENQKTAFATSEDGINFTASKTVIGEAYFRVFSHRGTNYAIDTHGFLNRSNHPDKGWHIAEKALIAPITIDDQYGKRDDVRIRHSAIATRGDTLFIFYTRKADAPERILVSTISMTGDFNQWTASDPIEILRPTTNYEGIQFPIKPSKKGGGIKVQQLRDPAILEDAGRSYIFYSISGEMGLAVAELSITKIRR